MIHTHIVYCPRDEGQPPGMDVLHAYRSVLRLYGDDDWVVFLDHDAMFTTLHWYRQIEQLIADHPDAGMFVPITNRTAYKRQQASLPRPFNEDSVEAHRSFGMEAERANWCRVVQLEPEVGEGPVGMCLIASAGALRGGGVDGVEATGPLEADGHLYRAAVASGRPVFLAPGLYVYHRYNARCDRRAAPYQSHYEQEWNRWKLIAASRTAT